MNPNDKQVKELRAQFLKKLEESESNIFHTFDVNRVKTDDKYLNRFLLHNDGNQENAFTMLWETCEWRKKFGVNDITEKNVNQTILESGSVYSHGKDKDGKTLLIFKSKKHFKGAHDFEDQKRCIVYWMERLERFCPENPSNLGCTEFGQYSKSKGKVSIKNSTSIYFNCFVPTDNLKESQKKLEKVLEISPGRECLVSNSLSRAMFRIIKSWLPPKAVEKMKFVNKSNVKDYVDQENCLNFWGDKDNYVFRFEPEERSPISAATNGDDNRKKVHFAEGSFKKDQLNESGFEESTIPVQSTSLSISPPDVLLFSQEGTEVTSTILLKNEDSQCISYKIKTTSPEKFRVRPSAGVLSPGTVATISVVLLPGYLLHSLQRDKFLIMSIPVEHSDFSPTEINEFWKQVHEKEVQQHRVKCAVPQISSNDYNLKNGSAFNSQSTDDQKMVARLCSDVTKLNTCVGSLKDEMKLIRQQQWIIIFAVILLLCSLSYVMYMDYINPQRFNQNCWADNRKG